MALKRAQNFVSALVAAAGAAASSYAPPWLLQKIGKGGMTVTSVALMVAAIVFFQTITEFLFLRLSVFRRLVSFGEFIEGHWVEVKFLYNPTAKRREVVGGSFVTISYTSGKLMCRGVFYENGRQKGDFVSRTAAFDGTALDYSFAGTDTDTVHGGIVSINGWGRFEFEPALSGSPWNVPSRYSAQVHATPKGLRHGFGIKAVVSNVPLNMTQKWLGHAQLATTAIYANAIGPEERQIAQRMWS